MANSKNIETQVIHGGDIKPRFAGAVNLPIFQSSTFEYGGQTDYHDLKYIRLNNTPNHQVLHERLALIEKGERALVTASGMAAISTALFAVLSTGDHLLAQNCLYGGTHDLLTKDFQSFGLKYDFIDDNNPASWEKKLRPETRAIYVESITNPLLQVTDFEAVVAFAKKHKLLAIFDNTFASPINFRPLEVGFDLSLHSCTKYLNGHSDIVGGACIGSAELIDKVKVKLNHLGGCMDPHSIFLLTRGIKTLALRVRQQNENALKLARFLAAHAKVGRVHYPGLETHESHGQARRFFSGFGGVISFELKDSGSEAADRLISALALPLCAPSLGGVESLITRPATTSHSGMSAQDRKQLGITDGLIRVSVGIEYIDDLIDDFKQALEHSAVKCAQ